MHRPPARGTFTNNGTAVTTDDTFTATVNITPFNLGGSTGWTSDETPPRTGLYADPNPVTFGPYPGRTPVTVVLRDNANPAVTSGPVVLNPPTATLTAPVSAVTRVNNGPGPADDTVTFNIDVAATNAGVAFTADVSLARNSRACDRHGCRKLSRGRHSGDPHAE